MLSPRKLLFQDGRRRGTAHPAEKHRMAQSRAFDFLLTVGGGRDKIGEPQ